MPEFITWKVVTEPQGFKIGEFVTSSDNDEKLKDGWKSREELKKGGLTPTFAASRLGDGQYFVLNEGPNADKALGFYRSQIAKSAGGEARVSTWAVYWITEPGPESSFNATLGSDPRHYQNIAEKVVYYGKVHGLHEYMSTFDVIFEARINFSGTSGPWEVQEGKVNPQALRNLVIMKIKDEQVTSLRARL
jgi:hypothetical protein